MFHDVRQNTDEWFNLRVGKITGSALSKAMANYGKSFGEPAKKYAISIAVEQITGKPSCGDSYSNDHMARGHEEEPIARLMYENEFFCEVGNGGFFENGDEGCSPDGTVGDDGLIEIKSAIPSIHYARIHKGSFDSAYKWQLIGNMKLTNREWIDFISFCSSFPDSKKLYVYRLHSKDFNREFDMIDIRVNEFRQLIEESKEIILTSEYMRVQNNAK